MPKLNLPPRDELRAQFVGWLPVRVAVRYTAISGYDRALALSAEAFTALIPMFIIVLAALPAQSREVIAEFATANMNVSEAAAEDVRQLVERPPQPLEPITLFGIGVLVVSLLGFTRTLQRTYQAAWQLPSQGVWNYGWGLLGALVLLAEFVATMLLGVFFAELKDAVLVWLALRLVLASALWWPVQWLLLGRRVGWRRLLPAALLLGVGQTLVIALSGAYLEWSIVRDAARYGLIGVAFVLVSWLIVLGLLIVLAAVLSAEMAPPKPTEDRAHHDGVSRPTGGAS